MKGGLSRISIMGWGCTGTRAAVSIRAGLRTARCMGEGCSSLRMGIGLRAFLGPGSIRRGFIAIGMGMSIPAGSGIGRGREGGACAWPMGLLGRDSGWQTNLCEYGDI
jgi:hypothetical protein